MHAFKSHWGHSEPERQVDKEEEDLTTALDAEQRRELTLLLARCAERICSNIAATFDVSQLQPQSPSRPPPSIDDSTSDPAAAEQAEKARKAFLEKLEKELSAPHLQQLKSEALKFADDWRNAVLRRVGEVVSTKEEAEGQKAEAVEPESQVQPDMAKSISEKDEGVDEALLLLYPPIPTPLSSLPKEHRMLVLHSMLLLLLSLEHYDAHSRVLLLYLTSSLRLPLQMLTEDETKVAHVLLDAAKRLSADDETAKKAEENKNARKWKVGLATAAGAVIIGATGALAAPLVAAGIGSVMGGLGLGATAAAGYLGTLASSGVLVGSLFGAYGGKMTGKMMDAYAKEVQDFAFLPVRSSKKFYQREKDAAAEDRRLRVTIGISGWLTTKEEVVTPWRVVGKYTEAFALRWELEALMNLGNSLTTMVTSYAWGYAKKEIIKRTIFASMFAALWPLGVLKIAKLVDNPFSVAKSRGDKAGEVLADALINKAQGERPVTLIGYSLGTRVIYSCLMSLAKRNAFGLIESVVLMGAPLPSDASVWVAMRAMVAGRLVNVYSENDLVLGFLYRTSSIQLGVAGLQRIDGVHGVENVDVSKVVDGHLRYRYLVGTILKKIGYDDVVLEEVAREEETLKLVEEEEEKEENKDGRDADAEEEAKRLEEVVKLKNEQGKA